jgi:phosphotransferase system HPr (HPr) family protein
VAPTSSESLATAASAEVSLPGDVDLHARPAAEFVRAAMRFESELWVASGQKEVDAKSLLSILALGAKRGTELRLRAQGPDAASALKELVELVEALHE